MLFFLEPTYLTIFNLAQNMSYILEFKEQLQSNLLQRILSPATWSTKPSASRWKSSLPASPRLLATVASSAPHASISTATSSHYCCCCCNGNATAAIYHHVGLHTFCWIWWLEVGC